MEQPRQSGRRAIGTRRRHSVALGVAASALALGLAWLLRAGQGGTGGGRDGAGAVPAAIPGDAGTERIVVEVLNATDIPGLARSATRWLRQEGIDVVYFGNAEGGGGGDGEWLGPLDSTRIFVRRGGPERGVVIARALGFGVGRVIVARDSTRLVDASVFLGRDLPASLHLHP